MREYPVQPSTPANFLARSECMFEKKIISWPKATKPALAELNRTVAAYADPLVDRVASSPHAARKIVFDITEPVTQHSSPRESSSTIAPSTCSSTTRPATSPASTS